MIFGGINAALKKDPKAQISFTQSSTTEWKIFVTDVIYENSIFDGSHPETFLDPDSAFVKMPTKVFENFMAALILQDQTITYQGAQLYYPGNCKNKADSLVFNFVSMDLSIVSYGLPINSL